MLTKKEFEERLRQLWSKRGHALEDEERIGVEISELIERSVKRNAGINLPYLELWVAIFDEFNSWLLSLLTIWIDERATNKLNDFENSVFMILSKIFSDTTSIRHLILLGHDNAARTLLRSTSEYMEVLVAILHDPNFSNEFAKSDTPESAKSFWENHLRSGKIRKRIRRAWYDFFQSEGHQGAQWFSNWGNSSADVLSGLAHPSFAGGLFSTIPPNSVYEEDNWLGFLGTKTDYSVDTIYIYASFMFPILMLSGEFPFKEYCNYEGELISYDENNELHRHVKFGREVLSSLILAISKDPEDRQFFPELDYSIYPREDESEN